MKYEKKLKKIFSWLFASAMILSVMSLSNVKAAGKELGMDHAKVTSFEITDTVDGKTIQYKKESEADYSSYESNPDQFSNAVCQNQQDSRIKLKLGVSYDAPDVLQEGDTLTINGDYGGKLENFTENPLPIKVGNNVLGTWVYKDGKFILTFSGDFIRDHQVKKFSAYFETGEMLIRSASLEKSTEKGKKYVQYGKVGKEKICTPFEYRHIDASTINNTKQILSKSPDGSDDHRITWSIRLFNDIYNKRVGNRYYDYFTPYLLEHNGQYRPNSYTGIYVEDTFTDCIKAPVLQSVLPWVTGIDDSGKVIEGWYSGCGGMLAKEVKQGSKSREEIKNSLKKGEYCIYDNHDGTYTLMLRWWDMNDSNGLTYDQLPQVKNAGGVGNLLKKNEPDIFGKLSAATIEKINKLYHGKALQNIIFYFHANYTPVKEVTEKKNTATIVTDQTGKKEYPATGKLTPPKGIADAPANPLSIKMIKTDKDSGDALSKGFKFTLEASADGNTWTAFDVQKANVEKGTYNDADKTMTPDENGVLQIKNLVGGKKYRFVEKDHPKNYQDVVIDNAHPNDSDHTKSANSKAVNIAATNPQGQVVVMYNEKETTEVSVEKKWVGPKKDSVTVHLYAGTKKIKSQVLSESNQWKHTFKKLDKLDENGSEIKYEVKEDVPAGYDVKIEKNSIGDFVVTNTNTEKTTVSVTKKWVGPEKDTVKVILKADGQEKETYILKKSEQWKHTFTNLDKYNKNNGELIKYEVDEEVPANYEKKIEGTQENGYTITNTNIEKIDIPVIKKWKGPELGSVKITLKANGQEKESHVFKASENWMHTFKGLPKYGADGKLIVYKVEEETLANYTSEVTPDGTGFIVTNTNTETVEVKVNKKWVGPKKDSVTVKLMADNQEVPNKTLTLNEGNKWTGKFTGLKKYNDNGTLIKYGIKEVLITDYTSEVTENSENNYTITNTNTETVEVKVNKKWVGPKKDSVTVQLMADNDEVPRTTLTLNEGNKWAGKFTGLKKYHSDGTEIKYTVKEVNIPNYESKLIKNADKDYTIINTNTETVEVKVNKKWVGPKKDSVTVQLMADNDEVPRTTLTLNEGNKWAGKFTGLKKYHSDGTEIKYTVKEVNIPNYESKLIKNADKDYTIINTNTEKTEVKVNKKWVGEETDQITVELYADNEKISSQKITKADKWMYTFKNLDKYNKKNGNIIKYEIKEVKLKGYKSEIKGDAKNGYIITNTQEKPNVTETPKKPEPKEKTPKKPETGDQTSVIGNMMVMTGSLLTALLIIRKKKFN